MKEYKLHISKSYEVTLQAQDDFDAFVEGAKTHVPAESLVITILEVDGKPREP